MNLDHQELICLTAAHTTCPVFSAAETPAADRLPKEISGLEKSFWPLGRSTFGWIAGILASLVLLGLLFILTSQSSARGASWAGFLSDPQSPSSTAAALVFPTKSPTPLPPSATPSPGPTATLSPTPTVRPTSTSTPTLPPPTPGPDLETPFGPSGRFILHRVEPGEALINLARLHGTTADVIRYTNYLLPGYPTWPGMLLVILPGQTEMDGLKRLRAIQLATPITVEELADQEAVPAEEIMRLNELGQHTTIPAGRWLILPRDVEDGS